MGFATKPALARQMIITAIDAGVPSSWVAGDEVYGNDPALRATLADCGVGYVLAAAKSHRVPDAAGIRRQTSTAACPPSHGLTIRAIGSKQIDNYRTSVKSYNTQ